MTQHDDDNHDHDPDTPDGADPERGSRPQSDADLVPAGGLDAPVFAALHGELFRDDPWSEQEMAQLIGGPGAIAWLATGRDYGEVMPVGFALAQVSADEAEILSLGVLPEARAKGLGARLVEAVADKARALGARTLYLEVAEDNAAARHLYGKRGFAEAGRRRDYYVAADGRTMDALVLARAL
jgi:ribosomal-protein-alanine N-acetyltransferase